jgi:hypothetical protein
MKVVLAAVLLCLGLLPRSAAAHCDTVDGPVVKDARAALLASDVTTVTAGPRAPR